MFCKAGDLVKQFVKKIERFLGAAMIAAGCLGVMPVHKTYALEACDVIGHYSTEESLFFYVNGLSGEVKNAFCEVENSTGEFLSVTDTEEDALHTLILWDAVTPYDEVKQDYLKEVVGELIANRRRNETFTIAQAGERLVYSLENSIEYAELMTVVRELENGEEAGTLLPLVYEAVRDLVKSERQGVTRIFVVTDGGKEAVDPAEKEKLSVLLERMAYPVYVLEWSEDAQEETESEESGSLEEGVPEDVCLVLKEMGAECIAYTRDRIPLHVVAGCSKEYSAVKVETKIPEGERDGSKKKVTLTIETTNGVFRDECIMDVPSGVKAQTEKQPCFLLKYKEWLLWGGAGATGFILIVLLLVLRRKRKIYRIAKEKYDRDAEAATVSRQHPCTEEDATIMHKIKLTNRGDEIITYQSGFKGAVIIGRNPNNCTLLINGDNSLSGRHCGIYVRRGHFYIRDLNSSNGTKVNGILLADEIEIRTGDIVKLGRAEYLIRLE